VLALLETILKEAGHTVTGCLSGHAALGELRSSSNQPPATSYQLLLTDLKMPDLDGFALLEQVRRDYPDLPVLVITSSQSVPDAVRALKQGALDYVQKPFEAQGLLATVDSALEVGRLRRESRLLAAELAKPYGFDNIVGDDPAMKQVYSLIRDVASANTTVLVEGESGTGKELVAQAIHYAGPRGRKPLVKVNCVTLSETLLESELFGHEKGAFTGAIASKRGLFEIAADGTLFLDEIGELTPSTQAKLLQFLQDGTFRRVGGVHDLRVDVRIIAATNRNLKEMVDQSRYREDLYYRLHVFPISLPPLRDRKGDVPRLARHFLGRFAAEMGKQLRGFTPGALRLLETHDWPGNVRELENAVERAAVLCKSAQVSETELAFLLPPTQPPANWSVMDHSVTPNDTLPLSQRVETFEAELIRQALQASSGNHTQAAKILGLKRTTLLAKMKKLAE
jgi:DNA-binding NtrC family response regulator